MMRLVCVGVLALLGCGDGSAARGVNGFVQKGPFVSGSSITIQELDEHLAPTGHLYNTVTNDDFGSFRLGSTTAASLVEIIAQGFYFDEVRGEVSAASLTLRSVSDLATGDHVNVNILTTLARDRIEHLVVQEAKSFPEARAQAEAEVLAVFGIGPEGMTPFETMNISQEGASNAALLAVSATLQGSSTVGEMSELLSRINLDLAADGLLDNDSIRSQIRANAAALSLSDVRANLEQRYAALGLAVTIPSFEDFVDSDGDGIINAEDGDTLLWGRASAAAQWSPRAGHSMLAFNDALWVMGGIQHIQGAVVARHGDVWSSTDGTTWTRATESAGWGPRHAHASAVFDGKLWLLAGVAGAQGEYAGDVWHSTNGSDWVQASAAPAWGPRAYHAAVAFNGLLWVIGGYGKGDVWSSTDGVDWQLAAAAALPTTSYGHAAAVFAGEIWVVAAGDPLGGLEDDLWHSADGVTWAQATTGPDRWGRRYPCVAPFRDRLWAIGGEDDGSGSTPGHVWSSADGVTWERLLGGVGWAPRSFHACAELDGRLWLTGGYGQPDATGRATSLSEVWYLADYAAL